MVFDEERGDDPFERFDLADQATYQAVPTGVPGPPSLGAASRRKIVQLADQHPRWTSADIQAWLRDSYQITVTVRMIEQVISEAVRNRR